jgi:hypothetical protein
MERNRQRSPLDIERFMRTRIAQRKFTSQMLELARNDYIRGFDSDQVDRYLKEGFGFEQMKVLSDCIGLGYPEEFLDFLCEAGMSGADMDKAATLFGDSGDVGAVRALMQGSIKNNAAAANVSAKSGAAKAAAQGEPEHIALIAESQEALAENYVALSERLKELERKLEEFQKPDNPAQYTEPEKAAATERLYKEKAETERLHKEIAELEKLASDQQDEITKLKAALRHERGIAKAAAASATETAQKPSLLTAALYRRRYAGIIRLVIDSKQTAEQIAALRTAMENGLSKKQITALINNNASAEKIRAVIEVALLEKSMKGGSHGT